MIKVSRRRYPRVVQGDILKDVDYIEYITEQSGIIEFSKITFPLVIVLTQDCDLEQDYRYRWSKQSKTLSSQDKWLLSVLVAPLYNLEHVYQGVHLSDLDIKMRTISSKKEKTENQYLRKNEIPRYHYLEFPENIPVVSSVIDFKHYFSVNVKYLKNLKRTNFVCSLSDLFKEDISQRFTSYLARIGLPEISDT